MPSAGTRWKVAFLLCVVLFGAFALWQVLAKADAEVGEDAAQRELVTLALKNRAACERDPVTAAKVLGPGVCQDAKEITERPPAEQGEPGPAGARGPVGPEGAPGPAGVRGPAGPRGPSGPPGVDGDSPACLLTANACTGPTGAVGPVGPRGPAGETGAQGERGVTGQAGEKGEQGAQGETGPQGVTGERGPQGEAGVNGRGIASMECDSQTPITFRWTYTDGTVGTATCGGSTPPTTPPPTQGARR